MSSSVDRLTHSSHWGAFEAVVHEGRLVDARPLASDRDPCCDLTPFRLDRPALTDPSWTANWLV